MFFDEFEKEEIMSIPRVWARGQLSQRSIREIQTVTGIPAQLVESVIWGMDTLDALKDEDWLVFKGGTCVQSYLPPELQRASVDLDFNSRIENPVAIKERLEALNSDLRKNGRMRTVHGYDFGSVEVLFDDRSSGTLNFRRRMPSRFGEVESALGSSIISKSVRIQINHHHAWLPAVEVRNRSVDLFVNSYMKPVSEVVFPHSSLGDLLADNILVTSNVGGFGRERFKDVYDMGALLNCDPEIGITIEKLRLIADRSNLLVEDILNGSRRTVLGFQTKSTESRGFASMVSKAGRDMIGDWEPFCLSVSEGLEGILSRL